jgi:succinate dehydrogenase / fumarate reductase flavoprotein subunit
MIDVLIIGSGGAGLTAALNAKKNNSTVLVVSKIFPTHSQTVQAQGGINAVLYEDNDSIENHINDTYNAAHSLANKNNISFLCNNAKDTILWLDSIGVPFNRTEEGKFSQRKFGGTKYLRTCYSSDYTGLKIMHTLFDQCIKENIEFYNEHFLLDLIIENNQCKGAIFYDIKNGNIITIFAKTTILATGGYAGIYSNNTTNSYSNSADGIAVAFKAGVTLSNMEFVQFHPTTLLNSNILISESARGEGAYLVDKDGNRFIDELKSRDEVTKAIYERVLNKEDIFLDLRHLGLDKINELIPQERKLAFQFSNIKIEEELLPIIPSAHYTMGGIKTNINGETNIINLYAVGECANASIHGANRLGGNSLLEIITLGKHVGIYVSNKAKTLPDFEESDSEQIKKTKTKIDEIFTKESDKNFYKTKEYLSNKLFEDAGIFKEKKKLDEIVNIIDEISIDINKFGIDDKSKIYNKNLIDLLEFKNILEVSRLVVLSALNREESRGSHYRIDFPEKKDDYNKSSTIQLIDNEIAFRFEAQNEN